MSLVSPVFPSEATTLTTFLGSSTAVNERGEWIGQTQMVPAQLKGTREEGNNGKGIDTAAERRL